MVADFEERYHVELVGDGRLVRHETLGAAAVGLVRGVGLSVAFLDRVVGFGRVRDVLAGALHRQVCCRSRDRFLLHNQNLSLN